MNREEGGTAGGPPRNNKRTSPAEISGARADKKATPHGAAPRPAQPAGPSGAPPSDTAGGAGPSRPLAANLEVERAPRERRPNPKYQDGAPWPANETTEDDEDSRGTVACQVCGSGANAKELVLCDYTAVPAHGQHLRCRTPPLAKVPKGRWFCKDHAPLFRSTERPWRSPERREPDEVEEGEGVASQTPSVTITESMAEAGADRTASADSSEDVTLEPEEDDLDQADREGAADGAAHDEEAFPESKVWEDETLLEYLRTRGGAQPVQAPQRVRRRACNWDWRDGKLYKLRKNGAAVEVPRRHEWERAIHSVHDTGHCGAENTYALARERFFFDNMRAYCKAYVASCHRCHGERSLKVTLPVLTPWPLVPFNHRVAVDCLGPLPPSRGGGLVGATGENMNYIIVAIDSYTKWIEAEPMPDRQAATCASFFYRCWVTRFGAPFSVLSDNGSEWQGQFAELLRRYGIKSLRTQPHTPTTNGLAERAIQTIRTRIMRLIGTDQAGWANALPQVLLSLRAEPQASTGVSPALALMGKNLVLERRGDTGQDGAAEEALEEGVDRAKLMAHQRVLQAVARRMDENLLKAQEQQKRDYAKRNPVKYKQAARQEGGGAAAPARADLDEPPIDLVSEDDGSGYHTPAEQVMRPPRTAPSAPVKGKAPRREPPAIQEVDAPHLAHLPDLREGQLVYRSLPKRANKAAPRQEGPYAFLSFDRRGKHVLCRDGAQAVFSFPIKLLRLPADLNKVVDRSDPPQ